MKNFLFFLSFQSSSLRTNHMLCTTMKDKNAIHFDLKKFLISYFKQEPKLKFAVDTYHGTNALMNAVSVKFPLDIDINLHNSTRFNNVINLKIKEKQFGFKILNIFNVSDNFCINQATLHSKYVFRFSSCNSDNLSIFEYPILSTLKHHISLDNLDNNLKELNLFCRKNSFTMFNDNENFLRRKLNISPLQLKLVKNVESFVQSSIPIHAIELEGFPVYKSKEIFYLLDTILTNSNENLNGDWLGKVEKIFKTEDMSKNHQNKSIENLSGLFLTNISFDQKIIEHEKLKNII